MHDTYFYSMFEYWNALLFKQHLTQILESGINFFQICIMLSHRFQEPKPIII